MVAPHYIQIDLCLSWLANEKCREQIQLKFYKKEVSNQLVIVKSSAIPSKIKGAALFSEVLRRLRNTFRDLPWAEKVEILT